MTTALTPTLAPWASIAVRQRLHELAATHDETDVNAVVMAVRRAQQQHHQQNGTTGLNLYAGSNITSPLVDAAHDNALSIRPALGWPGEKVQPAVDGIEELEVIAAQQLRRAFNCRFAEPRYLTATMANLGAYITFTQPGHTIAILAPEDGSHASHQVAGTAGVRGLRTAHLPYDSVRLDVDHARLADFVAAVRPAVILVGGSVIQFPMDLGPIRAAADRIGARVVFDASHVAGLIAAGVFPNPLDHGVDLMTFSTYKTLAGPAGGAAVTNDVQVAEQISYASYPVLSSNYDAARLGPLAIACAEAVEQAPAWAGLTVSLAQDLAARLAAAGLTVAGAARGYTQTHQVVINVGAFGGGIATMRRLERQGVYVGACRISGQPAGTEPCGIRIGTQEIVRRGATHEHAEQLTNIIAAGIQTVGEVTSEAIATVTEQWPVDIWGRSQL